MRRTGRDRAGSTGAANHCIGKTDVADMAGQTRPESS